MQAFVAISYVIITADDPLFMLPGGTAAVRDGQPLLGHAHSLRIEEPLPASTRKLLI